MKTAFKEIREIIHKIIYEQAREERLKKLKKILEDGRIEKD